MNPPGHLAVAYLIARKEPPARLRRLLPTSLGVLLPDLIDKPAMLIGLTPYGRTVGHSAVLWLALSLVSLALSRTRFARASGLLVVGGISHLIADLVDDLVEGIFYGGGVFSAWAGWPVTNPDMVGISVPHFYPAMANVVTALELATVVVVLVLSLSDHRSSTR